MDGLPFDLQGHSRQRFESAIKTLFDPKYYPYADKGSQYDLYKHLRCGMAHIMRPQGKIVFADAERGADRSAHLQVLTAMDNNLALVSEVFYTDFAEACKKMKQQMAAGAYPRKLTDRYLSITQVQS